MPAFICSTCGTQYPPSEAPPAHCPVCEDERQFIPPEARSATLRRSVALMTGREVKNGDVRLAASL